MQISIKPICDWPIYFTAFADERLACITQTSFHCTSSFMNPFLATVVQNRIIANSLFHTPPATYHLPPHLSYYKWTLSSFFLYSFSNLSLPTMISMLLSYHVAFPHSLSSRSSHLHYSRGKHTLHTRHSLDIISITITNSIGDSIQILDVILVSH